MDLEVRLALRIEAGEQRSSQLSLISVVIIMHAVASQHPVGRFCGKCQHNYGLAVYSYDLSSCVPCLEYEHVSWLKYIAIALGPLTVLYFIVALFGVNLAAGKMNGLIFSVQVTIQQIFFSWPLS